MLLVLYDFYVTAKKNNCFFIRFNSVYTVRKKGHIGYTLLHTSDKRIMVFICRMSHVCMCIHFFSVSINRRLLLLRIRAFKRGFQTQGLE